MNQEHPEQSAEQTHSPGAQRRDTRRRLIQGGLATAPVLLALKSTPVLAANCKLPSGFSISGNLSRPNDYVCQAHPPGPSAWLNTIPDADKLRSFQSVDTFGSAPLDSNVTNLLQALSSTAPLDRLITAAWLNAKYNQLAGLTTAMVRAMWDQGVRGAGYSPVAGATWHATQVQAYLQYLMP